MALTWEQHQKNIFGGESGGDYDALFGYQNRPDGAFSNVKVSQMPVGDVIDFTDPSGTYGRWVKGQLGYTATPVGAYQVVGTTLRDAVKALGIDPNQKFDKATQDKIGQYILKTQGTGAWEGYGKGGASMDNKPAQMAQQQQPQQQSQGLLGGLLGGRGIGGALGLSDDMRDRLRMAILSGSDPRAFAQQIAGAQQAISSRAAERRKQAGRNATADYLERIGQTDAANLLRQGAISAADALSFGRSTGDTAFEAKFNIYKKAMPNATDQEILAAMEGGPNTPAAIRELEMRAERAGLVAGTKEYEEFFRTAGLSDEAAAKAAGKAGGEAMVQAAGAKEDVAYATQLIDDLLNDPALDKVVGPLQGALPNVSADAVRVQAKIDRLSGQAFIAARQMLKGGGQITDFESKRAEAAYSLLMNTRLSDEDYRAALIEFKDAVQAGYNRLMAQAEAGGASSPQAPAETQAPDNDPLGIRG